jgi:hypothetical protein
VSADHDLIAGRHREEVVKELSLGMLSDAEGCVPREWLNAAARAMGLVIGGSFSPEMHEGVMAACMDTISTWAKQISK